MKIKNIFIITAAALALVSCNDFLDVKPSTELDKDELFKNEAGYADALTGVYAQMAGTDLYGRNLTYFIPDLLSGYMAMSGTSIATWMQYPYKHNDQNRNDGCISTIDGIWKNMYNNIANLNELLANIDGDKKVFYGDNYNIIKGEALGLRAYLHFELLRMFSQPYEMGKDSLCIPYVDELSTKVYPLLTEKAALDRVISDLKEAGQLMDNDPIHLGTTPSDALASIPSSSIYDPLKYVAAYHNRRLRFNYYAAIATLARAYLWRGDKANALACAKEVILDQEKRFPWVTNDNLKNIGQTGSSYYRQDRTFATEHIFAMNVEKIEDYTDGWLWAGTQDINMYMLPVSYAGENFYNGKDIRSQYLLGKVGYYTFSTKYTQQDNVLDCFQKRIPLIRVSEMYYIAAECEPNPDDGLAWLETVRSHRGLSDQPLSSSDNLESDIKGEYQKEFLGEGQLWYYYKRNMYESIPNAWSFSGLDKYTFDRPADEDLYGGR